MPLPLAMAIAAAFPVVALGQTTVAGVTKGNVAVTGTGAATYSLPIFVSPGSAGMQPDLTLAYSSQQGDDIAGFGWGLSGFTTIARCPKNLFQDEVIEPVHLNNTDRYCLSGQRLVAVVGSYGANGTEYRTEIDSGLRIFSYGGDGNGPTWWRVDARDGTQQTLGDTEGSRLRPPAAPLLGANFSGAPAWPFPSTAPIQQWIVRQTKDSAGNYMTYEYESIVDARLYPVKIKYTGNSRQGTAPYQEVLFHYEARPKTTEKFGVGTASRMSKRLSRIEVRGPGQSPIKEYRLGYTSNSPDNWRQESRLTSIKECSGDGTECLNPTTFEYTDFHYNASQQASTSATIDAGYESGRAWADVNGDGFADYCRIVGNPPTVRMEPLPPQPRTVCDEYGCYTVWDEGGWQAVPVPGNRGAACRLSSSGSFSNSEISTVSAATPDIDWGYENARWWIDFNSDGKADFCRFVDGGGGRKLKCNLSTGGGFDAAFETPSTVDTGWVHAAGWPDFNGDGRPDFCRVIDSPKRIACTTSAGTAFDTPPYTSDPISAPQTPYDMGSVEEVLIGDVNGDGLPDFCWPSRSAGLWGLSCMHSTGNGFTSVARWEPAQIGPIGIKEGRGLVDINSDGLADFCRVSDAVDGPRAYCTLSNGNGWTRVVQSHHIDMGFLEFRQWGDVNGDGDADYCRLHSNGANKQVNCLLTHNGTFSTQDIAIGNAGVPMKPTGRSFAEFDGDGKLDFCHVRDNGSGPLNSTLICNHSSIKGAQNKLVTVTEGVGTSQKVGGAYKFSYLPLTDPSVYPWRVNTSHPFAVYMSSDYVVDRLISDNGIAAIGNRLNESTGSPFTAFYRYFNGQIHLLGGGFLGYEVQVVSDAQAQTHTEVWHSKHDQFPFHGQPVSTRVYRWGEYLPYKPAKETYVTYKHAGHLPVGQYGVSGDTNSTAYKANLTTAKAWLNCSGTMSSSGGRLRRSLPESTLEMTNEPGVYYDQTAPGATPTAPSSARKTVNTYDNCGNATSIVMSHVVPTGTWAAEWSAPSTGESVTTTNVFQNVIDSNRWHLGRLMRSTTTSVKP